MSDETAQRDRRIADGRRRSDHWITHEIESVREQLKDQGDRLVRLESTVDGIRQDTSDVREILQSARGFFKVLGVIGHVVKWLAAVTAAIAALWYMLTGMGGPPSNNG